MRSITVWTTNDDVLCWDDYSPAYSESPYLSFYGVENGERVMIYIPWSRIDMVRVREVG